VGRFTKAAGQTPPQKPTNPIDVGRSGRENPPNDRLTYGMMAPYATGSILPAVRLGELAGVFFGGRIEVRTASRLGLDRCPEHVSGRSASIPREDQSRFLWPDLASHARRTLGRTPKRSAGPHTRARRSPHLHRRAVRYTATPSECGPHEAASPMGQGSGEGLSSALAISAELAQRTRPGKRGSTSPWRSTSSSTQRGATSTLRLWYRPTPTSYRSCPVKWWTLI
jgi:hypothetical protein